MVGLHWLSQGEFVVGSDPVSGIRLTGPSAPGRFGTLTINGDSVHMRISTGLDAFVKGTQVYDLDMTPGVAPEDGLKIGGVTMVLIKRGPKLALRVWDAKAPNLVAFKGLNWMPVDTKWRINARFVPHPANQPRIKIQNVLGETVEMKNPGQVVFAVGGTEYRLEAMLEKRRRAGAVLYFQGRHEQQDDLRCGPLPLHAAERRPSRPRLQQGEEPPCAFTDFATCPLPPAKSTLSVTAGELDHKH